MGHKGSCNVIAPKLQTHAKQLSNLRLYQFEYSVQTVCQWNVDKLELSQKKGDQPGE